MSFDKLYDDAFKILLWLAALSFILGGALGAGAYYVLQ